MEKAIEQLKSEGYTSDEIKSALLKMKEETMKEPVISGSLDNYLDSI